MGDFQKLKRIPVASANRMLKYSGLVLILHMTAWKANTGRLGIGHTPLVGELITQVSLKH